MMTSPHLSRGGIAPIRVDRRRAVPTGLNPATLIGSHVTIEPFSVLRACRVEPKVLIGARSVVCEGAIIESEAILAPGSVVPPARRIPSGELWGGNPARFIRKLTSHEVRVKCMAWGNRDLMHQPMHGGPCHMHGVLSHAARSALWLPCASDRHLPNMDDVRECGLSMMVCVLNSHSYQGPWSTCEHDGGTRPSPSSRTHLITVAEAEYWEMHIL